jgi:hypothetical protein
MNADFLKQMMSQKGGKDGAGNMDFLQNRKYPLQLFKRLSPRYHDILTKYLLICSIQLEQSSIIYQKYDFLWQQRAHPRHD